MSDHAKVVRLFKSILQNAIPSTVTDGVIKAVDEMTYTCTVTISGVDFYKVPMKVLISATQASVVEVPAVNSACTIVFKDKSKDRPTLLYVNVSDKLLIKITNSTIEITSDLIKFNGGGNDGLVLVNALITKLNNLENAFNAHMHATAATGPPSIPTPIPGSIPIVTTVKADLENTKITQ
jgi:hypothetical protein